MTVCIPQALLTPPSSPGERERGVSFGGATMLAQDEIVGKSQSCMDGIGNGGGSARPVAAAARWQQAAVNLPLLQLRSVAEMGVEQRASLHAVQGQVRTSTVCFHIIRNLETMHD